MSASRLIPLLFCAAVALSTAQGCRAMIGDSCDTDSDCGRGQFCEQSLPGGYCTQQDCLDTGCDEGGVCILFDNDASYCMKACSSDGDCRGDYLCVQDFGRHPFCHIVGPAP